MSSDKKLSVYAYWEAHKWELARLRGWRSSTIAHYNNIMKKIDEILREKEIGCIVVNDIFKTMKKARTMKKGGGVYAESSMQSFCSVLWDIFSFAADRGDAINVMRYYHLGRSSQSTSKEKRSLVSVYFNPAESQEYIKEKVQELREQKPYIKKSLRLEQRILLWKIIDEKIEEDGRYVCLAIMLYAGLRPAEARAICWEDIRPFVDRPDESYLIVNKTLDQKGEKQDKTKTDNGYRRIPIHVELKKVLERRKDYIRKVTGTDPKGYICSKNDSLGEPVWSYELAAIADKVMNKKILDEELMAGCILELDQELSGNTMEKKDSDVFDHFTLYVLRRNFWTTMQADTELTKLEKLYLMGHKMEKDGINMRPHYNREDCLLGMLAKINRFVFHEEDHIPLKTNELLGEEPHTGANVGFQLIRLSKELMKSGGVLKISVFAKEANDPITVSYGGRIRRALDKNGISVQTKEVAIDGVNQEINLEYDNWRAINNVKKRIKRKNKA